MTAERSNSNENLPPPVLVEDAESFERLCSELQEAREIGFDTEADSFYRYQERVCLIQITVNETDYVVDPLRDFELDGLGPIFADEAKTKVFHDGEYDILILKRDFDFSFAGIFDTRVAAAALGLSTPGLASVVLENFGVELDKSQQRSDWSRRPLTENQIAYARQDTRYLLPLMHRMREELEELGRMPVLEGECRRLEALEAVPKTFNPDDFLRLKGSRLLDAHQKRALRELYVWRDEEARQRDVPPFKVLGNNYMLDIARSRPRSIHMLEKMPGLSAKIVRRMGNALVKVIHAAEELGPLNDIPRLPPRDGTGQLDEAGSELHDRLKTWRKTRANQEGFDASLVLNRHPLMKLAAVRPKTIEDLAGIAGVQEWQIQLFGSQILDVIATFEADLAEGRFVPGARRSRRRNRR